MLFFGFGGLIYVVAPLLFIMIGPNYISNLLIRVLLVSVLVINAIAILSEDRFLARIGWSSTTQQADFGAAADSQSAKAKIVQLISSVRTLMRVPLIAINTFIILYELFLG